MQVRVIIALIGLVTLNLPGLARATDPDGSDVFNAYLQYLGGTDAMEAVESFTARGTYSIDGGPSGVLRLQFSRPDKLLFELTLDGIGRIAQGFDCLLYTSPSPRDRQKSRMPSSA